MSKKFFALWIIVSFCLTGLPLQGFCEKKPTLSIALTGDFSGRIWPIRMCSPKNTTAGGIARRATIVDIIRKTEPDLLLLDAGNALPESLINNPEVKARIILKGMDAMGYSALNVGPQDLILGGDFLKENSKGLSFDLVSANLVYQDSGEHFAKPFMLKEIQGLKVAVLGVAPALDPDNTKDLGASEKLKFADPEKAIEETLSRMGDKADFVVLLSLLDTGANRKLLEKFEAIDLLVASDKYQLLGQEEKTNVNSARYAMSSYKGTSLQYLRIEFAEDGGRPNIVSRKLALTDVISDEKRIERLIQEEYTIKAKQDRLEDIRKQAEAEHERFEDTLKLSPEEYMQTILNKNSAGKEVQ